MKITNTLHGVWDVIETEGPFKGYPVGSFYSLAEATTCKEQWELKAVLRKSIANVREKKRLAAMAAR